VKQKKFVHRPCHLQPINLSFDAMAESLSTEHFDPYILIPEFTESEDSEIGLNRRRIQIINTYKPDRKKRRLNEEL
jgi:hypothetical protein